LGSPDLLRAEGARLGFDVNVIAPVTAGGASVSSSVIREALARGAMGAANRDLGYRWFVMGTVVAGDRRGRTLGFPTANIRLPDNCRLRHGIYAVKLTTVGKSLDAVASFGRRPTFDNGAPLLEIHALDFSGELYGEDVVVTFVDWIRPEARFGGVEELIAAMREDVDAARRILAAAGRGSPVDQALAETDAGSPVVAAGAIR
jgi:riboflavin kinase/FMN adenylyltransferase